MGSHSRIRVHSHFAETPGTKTRTVDTLAPMLPTIPPPDSITILTFLPREKRGNLGKPMPHAASWPAALTALPLVGAERLPAEPAVAASRSLPDGAFPTLGAEGHDVVEKSPAIVHFRADWGRAPTHLSEGRGSEASFLRAVRSRV
jgi:hypothetical protein